MPLTVIIPEAVINDPDIVAITETFQRVDATNVYHPLGTIYTFKADYELKFSQAAYDLFNARGCIMNGGIFYAVATATKVVEPVVSSFEDSLDEKKVPKTWKDYSIESKELKNGSTRLRCLSFPTGKTYSQNGLSDEERKKWHTEFGGLLVRAEGEKLDVVGDDSIIITK